MPKAVPRCRPAKAWAISASDVANMTAAPTPWTTRDRLSIRGVVDSPQAREDNEKTTTPTA